MQEIQKCKRQSDQDDLKQNIDFFQTPIVCLFGQRINSYQAQTSLTRYTHNFYLTELVSILKHDQDNSYLSCLKLFSFHVSNIIISNQN